MSKIKYGFTAQQILNEGRIKQEDIDNIKAWLSTQNYPELTDEQIILFLLSCYKEQEATRTTIKVFYSTRNGAPNLFDNRNMDRQDIQKQLKTVEFCVFPERTEDGCAVIFHRLYDTYFSHYDMEPSMKLLFMTLDAAIHDHPPTGLVILFDMKGVGLMHLTKARLGLIKVFFQYLQEGLPVRLKTIHVLNSVYFLDKVMAIIKPFMKKEVMEQVHFHPSNMDMELFYKNCLPKKCLPEEIGGDLPSVRVLHEDNIKKLTEMEPYFDAEEQQRHSVI